MNRREFLIAVGAVPVAAYIAGKTLIPPSLKLAHEMYPWQQHIWNMLESGKKVMYVTSTQKNAWRIFNVFQRHKNLFTTHTQGSVMGRRADLVVMDDFEGNVNAEWYNMCVRTRLTPGGEIEWIHT